jgi:hypothetical protein
MTIAANQTRWQFTGDYFGSCNCDVVCPCFLSAGPFLSAKPTNGFCELALVFHVDQGQYGDISLDDLNTIVVARIPARWTKAIGQWPYTWMNAPISSSVTRCSRSLPALPVVRLEP